MPKYIMERDIPNVGTLTTEQLQEISQKSCCVLSEMGNKIQWLQSYVCDNKIYCIYIAPNEAAIYEHATKSEFPVNKISQIKHVIDPNMAED